VPLRAWLAGALGDQLLAELGSPRLRDWIDVEAVRALLQQHRSGVRDRAELLWAVLVFARFLRRWCA
jgi:asparagine synthase (glutamine-hydrolysing)